LLISTVKVRRVLAQTSAIKNEETKNVEFLGNTDYLLNYTFDLSLDDHMRAGNNQFYDAGAEDFDDVLDTSTD
jgi:hypothetical protein